MPRDTRRAMVLSAVEVLRERAADGVTLDAILARSGASRGSIYHHFPDGRRQIVEEAVRFAGDAIARLLDRVERDGFAEVLSKFHVFWTDLLVESDYNAGCPVVSVAVSSGGDAGLAAQAQEIFTRWHASLRDALITDGLNPAAAGRLATMTIASVEGAVVMCRAQRSVEPLDDTVAELLVLARSRLLFGS